MEIRVNSNDIEKALKLLKRKLEKNGRLGTRAARCRTGEVLLLNKQ